MRYCLRHFLLCMAFCIISIRLSSAAVDLPVPYLQQPNDQTCLPTCLAMTLHFKGKVELTTSTVFQLHRRTRYDRYNLPNIVKDYNLYALPCWYELGWNADTLKKELDAGHPVITGCDLGRHGHFVLITGYTDDGKWIVHDPSGKASGYRLGGPHVVTDWQALNWRGGIFIHPEPFPEPQLSGRVVSISAPHYMAPGEIAEVRIDVKNNGKQPWPEPTYLEAIEPSFTICSTRQSPFFVSNSWISPSRVMVAEKVAPDDIAHFVFKIKAPQVSKPTIFKEYWNLLDAQRRRLPDSAASGPGLLDMAAKIHVEPKISWLLPLIENARDGKPSLNWFVRFGSLEADTTTTRPNALRLLTPGMEYDTAWLGDASWSDYRVEAMIYCEYRPEALPHGWDRIGIFLRDNDDHAPNTNHMIVSGECYCMTYDSDDGRLRAGNTKNGGIDDFHPKPYLYLKKSGWHKFAIRCSGETISYELDNLRFHTTNDDLRTTGSCGVFYRTTFKDRSLSHGVRFAEFKAVP
jgi:hypothetical protein